MSQKPVMSVVNPAGSGHSPCKFTFNPSFVPAKPGSGMKEDVMFVRAAECPDSFGGSNDHVMMATADLTTGALGDLQKGFQFASGSEDPRVYYNKYTSTYYNFMYMPGTDSKCTNSQCTVQVLSTKTPLNQSSWKNEHRFAWHRNGCVFRPGSSTPYYALWGEGNIGISSTTDFETFSQISDAFLKPLGPQYSESKLEAGAPPVQLSDGNWLHLYAAATPGWDPPNHGNYTAGAAIISAPADGSAAPAVVWRSKTHPFVPLLPYQQGLPPYPRNRADVIFLPTVVPMPGETDLFRVWFGAADASIGTALMRVKKISG